MKEFFLIDFFLIEVQACGHTGWLVHSAWLVLRERGGRMWEGRGRKLEREKERKNEGVSKIVERNKSVSEYEKVNN